jgi:hypothetical protein
MLIRERIKVRKLVTNSGFTDSAIKDIRDKLEMRLEEKGYCTYASIHEISGIIGEKIDEMKEAVHGNDQQQLRKELISIAVCSIWGIVSIDADGLDW